MRVERTRIKIQCYICQDSRPATSSTLQRAQAFVQLQLKLSSRSTQDRISTTHLTIAPLHFLPPKKCEYTVKVHSISDSHPPDLHTRIPLVSIGISHFKALEPLHSCILA
ncbi:hypothetical protein K443DRAFT_400473 [Laccaria amethystina LaAM-08-1]|uniref:Uncharacterized protein n=1 Tax=Laccaria amethystina LaAM-08-1 TaxID=1095629 RepID=A0A0C9XSX8_9AGAR|nr:hypothetical protein K443DRAFT_400473 [Laccaria amethystina LaAM-08-1]